MPAEPLAARYQKLKILYKISDLINSTTNPAKLLRMILREAVREMKATSGTISFVNLEEQVLEIAMAYRIDPRTARQLRLPMGEGITGWVAKNGKPLRLDDVTQSPQYVELKSGVRSELAVPLRVEGKVIGVLNVNSARPAAFSIVDEKLLIALANQAAKVIQTSRLYDDLTRQTQRLEALFDVGQALISPDPLPDVLKRISQTVLGLLDVKLCSIMLLNEKRELVLSAVSGGSEQYSQRPALSVNESLIGQVVTQRQPIQVYDVKKAPRYRSHKMARKEGLASLLSVPILFHDTLIGIINIYTAKPRLFQEEELRLLNAFASLCAIAIENAQRYERVLRAEHSIRQSDRLATLGILSAEIAHEIRNPVTIITMLLHSLREEKAIASGRERDVEIITDKLERINRIVSQVLNFSKERETLPEWTNLNVVLDELLFLVNHNAAARQVMVRKQFDPELPRVLGDRGHFDQVFLNLILNALDAMPNGGILTVKTSHAPAGEDRVHPAVSVTIRDTGKGITPELLPQLFSPFVSTRKEGIGLGLFVSQKLLSEYGGQIHVKSAPEKGAAFTVEIPIEPGSA